MLWVIPTHHALAIRYIAAWECMREYGRVWEKNTCRLILSGVLQAGAERLSAVFSHIFNPPRGTQVCALQYHTVCHALPPSGEGYTLPGTHHTAGDLKAIQNKGKAQNHSTAGW